ncbi:MAG: PhoH family protein [Verrucomicrobia bacterium]|nr:PhoH family protein [Kiritimatiellia bacterium]MCO6401293.1 PhoH family protein [Verrucomicrobiota bacterium]
MKKNFILDTNVLLHEATAIQRFQDNNIIIPLKVIEEIDHFKKDQTELGRNARHISRLLDELRQQRKLNKGVDLPHGGTLRIAFPGAHVNNGSTTADDQILELAIQMRKPGKPRCIVVTKDINLRLKADALGLDAEDYRSDRVDVDELYTGHTEHFASGELLDTFRREGRIAPPDGTSFSPNEYVLLRAAEDPTHTILVRHDAAANALVPLIPTPDGVKPVLPRNKEQHYAMDALLNDDIKVVTIIGKAGTGKTLLAVAAAVFKTMLEKRYRRMLICRPTVPMGKDIGYLPGTLEEKLTPWMQPIYDALDFLSNGNRNWKRNKDGNHEEDRIGIEPLTYIRGRSIPNQFIVVDEAQNLTPLEAKTVLTRVGPGTKIVLTGDIYQIDNPFLDSMSNGLSTVVEKFRPHGIAAHIVLGRGVRSEVAELAANLL